MTQRRSGDRRSVNVCSLRALEVSFLSLGYILRLRHPKYPNYNNPVPHLNIMTAPLTVLYFITGGSVPSKYLMNSHGIVGCILSTVIVPAEPITSVVL
jgi:hypothetical protein